MLPSKMYAVLASGVLALACPHAMCQATGAQAPASPPVQPAQGDLKAENERLQKQVNMLVAQLEAAQAKIKMLEERLAAATAAPPVPSVPADPSIGPGGLLSALRADYMSTFGGKATPSSAARDTASQQAWSQHQKQLENWIAKAQRTNVSEQRWTCTMDPATVTKNGREVSLTLVFENGTHDFRTPVTVDQGVLNRVLAPDGTVLTSPVVVTCVVTPKLTLNPGRPEGGPFSNPPLVGPYVDYGYELKVKSILPPGVGPSK